MNDLLPHNTLVNRLKRHAVRYWTARRMQAWPTVAQTARALRVRQDAIREAADGDQQIQLTSHFSDNRLGEYFVEVMNDKVDQAWINWWERRGIEAV